jgi:hypothetical protein
MSDFEQLLERVRSAKEADQSLSRAIMLSLGGWHRVTPAQGGGKHGKYIAPEDWMGRDSYGKPILDSLHGTTMYRDVPHVTSSIDAALALVEKALPGFGFYLRQDKDGCGCGLVYPEYPRVTPAHCSAATPALAILAALLSALIAQRAALEEKK